MINFSAKELREFKDVNDSYMSDLLHSLRDESFEHQKSLQVDGVIMERLNFNISDFTKKLITSGTGATASYRRTKWMDYPFINPARHMGVKRAGLLWKEINFYDISQNSNIFDKNYMVFVDGALVDYINIIVRYDGVEFVCNVNESGINANGLNYIEFKELCARNVEISVVLFSNSTFNPLKTDLPSLVRSKRDLYQGNPEFINSLRAEETYLTFVRTKENGFAVKLSHLESKDTLMRFYKDYNSKNPNKRGFVNIYGFKNLAEIIEVEFDETVIQIPGYNMPVPVENILVFAIGDNGEYRYDPSIKLTHKFPNFYEVQNDNFEDLALLVFYSEGNERSNRFYNEIESYYRYMGDSVESYNDAPADIKDFEPAVVDFSIKEFHEYDTNDPLFYKVQKLSELALQDPEYLRTFLRHRHTNGDGYYIDVSKVDLSKRIRYDNSIEVKSTPIDIFSGAHYVITLKDPYADGLYEFNILIDGIMIESDHVYDSGVYTFVYIPVTSIEQNSIIEVERNRVHHTVKLNHRFGNDEDKLTINVEPGTISIDDFNFVEVSSFSPISSKSFEFSSTEGTIYGRDVYEIFRHPQINVRCIDSELYGKDIRINYGRGTTRYKYNLNESGSGLTLEVRGQGVIERGKIRAYRNGRSLPVYSGTPYNGESEDMVPVTVLAKYNPGDEIILEYNPNNRRVILDLPNVPDNGIIDFHGFIYKPFDLTWYDLYVNGRKINKFNVDFISPYVIHLKNLQSTKNLIMYEVSRPVEIIELLSPAKTVMDEVWESNDSFRETVKSTDTNIVDVEQDTLSENIYWYTEQAKDVIKSTINTGVGSLTRIQPDIKQISPNTVLLNHRVIKDEVAHITPDKYPDGLDVVIAHKLGAN